MYGQELNGESYSICKADMLIKGQDISNIIWIVTNRKPANRKGKVQLIDASGMWQKMRKSLGSKRKELSDDHIAEITRLFGEAKEVWVDKKTGKPVSRKALAAGYSDTAQTGRWLAPFRSHRSPSAAFSRRPTLAVRPSRSSVRH